MNASGPRKVTQQESPTDTAPDAVGPSVARVEAAARALYEDRVALTSDAALWPAWKDHEPADAAGWRDAATAALAAADAVEVAPDGHAALVARIEALIEQPYVVPFSDRDDEGVLVSELRAAITATDRAVSDESRVAADRDALQVECDEAIAQAERHAEDVATAEREVSALRVTVAERDEVRGQLRAATSSLKRVRDVIEDDEMLNRFGHVNFDEDNDAAGARELQGIVAAALDGPDDRSGEAGLCSGSSTGVHLWIGRLAEDGPYRWCEWCKETRSLR